MIKDLFRRKTLESILKSNEEQNNTEKLSKSLSVKDLTMMGVGAVIGAGIFSTIGAAAFKGGPGVIVLFLITAITCGFTALCYAEFASRIPTSGSAYTYSYVAFGEIIAWIIGWALILEYAIGNIVVAISWSSYFNNVLLGLGIKLPAWLISDYKTAQLAFSKGLINIPAQAWRTAPELLGIKMIVNIPAFFIVVMVTILAYIGIKESKKSANAMVIVKVIILLIVIGIGITYINTDNYVPFFPNNFGGVLAGVSAVFYAYIGFDAISTTAEECKNPQRDLPRGMIYSLIICTIIYIVTALVITGMVPYSKFEHITDPLAFVFEEINKPFWGKVISVSAVIAATSVMLVFQIGQPRIWMSMSRDGLIPKKFGKIHPKYKTPGFATIVTGFLVAIPTLFIDADLVTDLTSIGTLFAFVIVCGGVLTLPKPLPTQKFKIPYINSRYVLPFILAAFMWFTWEAFYKHYQNLYNTSFENVLFVIFWVGILFISGLAIYKQFTLIPILGLSCCLYLMVEIPKESWIVFFFWMLVGLIIYFCYGYKKSKLRSVSMQKSLEE